VLLHESTPDQFTAWVKGKQSISPLLHRILQRKVNEIAIHDITVSN